MKNLKLTILTGLFLLTPNVYSYMVSVENKRDILEMKREMSRINSYTRNKYERSNNSFRKRELKKFYQLENALYKMTKQLHKDLIVKDEDDQYPVEKFKGEIKLYSQLFERMVSMKGLKYIHKRTQERVKKVAYHLDHIIDDFDEIESSQVIDNISEEYAGTLVENYIKGDYEGFYKNIKDAYKKSKKAKRKYWTRKLGFGKRKGPKNTKNKHYKKMYQALDAYHDLAKKMYKNLDEHLSENPSKVNPEALESGLVKLSLYLNHFMELFNSKEFQIDEKMKISDIINNHKELMTNFARVKSDFNVTETTDVDLTAKTFEYYRANQVCSLLGSPGNILLRKSIDSDIDMYRDFGPSSSKVIKFLETIKFQNRDMKFRHAEVITKIEDDTDITTMGFYPWMFNMGLAEWEKLPSFVEISKGYQFCPTNPEGMLTGKCDVYTDYRSNYAWLKVKALSDKRELKKKEDALKKMDKKKKYTKMGVCSDFVNWAFKESITSNWNVIPGIKQAIQLVWIPEAWQTPDNLYDSYMTKSLCEVTDNKLVYPLRTNARQLVSDIKRDMNSKRAEIKDHATKQYEILQSKGFIDDHGEATVDTIEFKKKEVIQFDW